MNTEHTPDDNMTSLVNETLQKLSAMNADSRHKELMINEMILTLQAKRAFGRFTSDRRSDLDHAINTLFLSLIYNSDTNT